MTWPEMTCMRSIGPRVGFLFPRKRVVCPVSWKREHVTLMKKLLSTSEMTQEEFSDILTSSVVILGVITVAIALIILIIIVRGFNKTEEHTKKKVGTRVQTDAGTNSGDPSSLGKPKSKKKQGPDKGQQQRPGKVSYNHPWLLSTLKAHSGTVLDLDFSSNKKYLASCADDRTVMLWNTKDFTQKDHKFVRTNVELDYAKKVKWSPDSKAFLILRGSDNEIEVYKVSKKESGGLGNVQSSHTLPTKHKDDIIGMGIASTGKFLMTCSADTNLVIWNLKGETLATIDTHQVSTYYASVSPCGRFVASCGFTSDVKIWQVVFDKMGEFKQVVRAFELKGHSAGVESFAFNDDSSKMATVSKDKTWKLWDTKVEFDKGQEPYLLLTSNCQLHGPAIISLSPDGRVVAIATGSYTYIYSAVSGNEEKRINNEGPVTWLGFDPYGKYLLASVNRHVRIFHNVVGYKILIHDLEERRKSATNQSMKDRIQQQISEARRALEAVAEL